MCSPADTNFIFFEFLSVNAVCVLCRKFVEGDLMYLLVDLNYSGYHDRRRA